MTRSCVIGDPVAQSLSPKLHSYWLKHYGIDGEYTAQHVKKSELAEFIRTLPDKGFAGCNVTIPHKEQALALVDEADALAQEVGAVNTVIVLGQKTFGTNTDVAGFTENINNHITGKYKAVILGAGGAARAVIVALKRMGFAEIIITNRTRDRAEELAAKHGLSVVDWTNKDAALAGADLLVNTTSLGLSGGEPLAINLEQLPTVALVTDIVYKPLITPLLAAAAARGNPTVDGLGMLLHQAAPAFEAWFGTKPEVTEELRAHLIPA